MHRAILYPVLLLAAYISYHILQSYFSARRHARRAIAKGCKPPPTGRSDPFGILNVRNMLLADRARRLPDYALERFEGWQTNYPIVGGDGIRATMRSRMPLRKINYVTVDPKNIQAMLATQFSDFELGEARTASLERLLGVGIVSHPWNPNRLYALKE